MVTITYYDFSDLNYASLFVEGFFALENEGEVQFKVTKEIPAELKGLELPRWITYRKPASTSVFRYQDGQRNFLFCIDANDHNGLDPDLPDVYPGYHLPLISKVDYYFKVNYYEEVVTGNLAVAPFAHKILPIPLVYPLRVSKWRSLRPPLTPWSGQRWPLGAARRRINKLRDLISLEDYRDMRQQERDLDLFFVTTIYMGRDHERINAWRLELLQAIKSHTRLNTHVGIVSKAEDLPGPFAAFQLAPMPFEKYMAQLARSKIGLYTRGTYGAVSFKFGQYFALGKPVVGEPLLNNRQQMYTYDLFAEQFNFTEPNEIAERIAELIANPRELQQLQDANTATFENHFTPKGVAKQIVAQIEKEREPQETAEAAKSRL